MKFILIFSIFVICFSGCVNREAEESEIIPDRFRNFMNTYFYGYKYEYQDTNARGNHDYGEQYGLININKVDLNTNDIKNIYKKLEEEGWRIVETNHKNYVNLCYGENFSLIIFYPLKWGERTPSGIPLSYDSIDDWQISLYKSNSKLAACNQNPDDFIDFTKL